jgi:divinyl chlorophyllide a 8-vinyl-reductase
LTAREQGELLFAAAGMEPRFRQVPVAMMDAIIGLAAFLGRFSATWADRAEFARTGRYYATESMLVWDAEAPGATMPMPRRNSGPTRWRSITPG